MDNLIQLKELQIPVLNKLLMDKTTGKNIIWATDSYSDSGKGYQRDQQMLFEQVIKSGFLQPRILKSLDVQKERTKKNAEVYTPAWICNLMNNQIDQDWFDDKKGFNQQEDKNWIVNADHISFLNQDKKTWKEYVNRKVLEITCGEAPFLVSRYDSSTGNPINIQDRVGLFDRKLRVVTENTNNFEDWYKWALKALKSTYGYEFQGDSLLIGRVNVYLTLLENAKEIWKQDLTVKQQEQIADIICWNLFQMDGLTDCIPVGAPADQFVQSSLFDFFETEQTDDETTSPPVIINWWDNKAKITIIEMKEGREMSKRKFCVCLGNPPYQETQEGTSDKPVYNEFMDAAYRVASKVELITPARFLFNAGKTPKKWNEKMLMDSHLKVIDYEQDSSKVFSNTDIKGGVAITYRDAEKNIGPIEIFSPFPEMRSILNKIQNQIDGSVSDMVYSPESYRFSQMLHDENPQVRSLLSKGHDNDLTTNIFDKLSGIIFRDDPEKEDVGIQGRQNNNRTIKYLPQRYLQEHPNLDKWKVILPKSNGSGAIGEVLSTPLIGQPLIGHTQSFISIGNFNTKEEASNLLKYIKSKFARTALGILKVTQDNKKSVWKYVPLQDFTDNSDIDWSKSIPEIDQQLYKKYGLSPEEIEFIETHVKEME